MARSEPTLVPEWLKGTNGSTNSGSTGGNSHQLASSKSDDHAITLPTRNRSSVSDHDSPRSFVDRTSSSQIRRSSSSNGSIIDKDSNAHLRSYSSFTRGHRDRDRDWDKDIEFRLGDHGIPEHAVTTSASLFSSKLEKDILQRTQSMISGRRGEGWPRRLGNDSGSVSGSIISPIQKSAFERDFPSLGVEEKQGVSEISRVSSPGTGSASQNLPLASASVIGGECWTSALAEIPAVVGSNSTVLSPVQQVSSLNSPAAVPNTSTGLNMAETLAQAPARARAVPHLAVETQRLEELAIKQSRQLIPMTPSMPKTSALNSDKTKPKASRAGDLSNLTKFGHLSSPSQLVNNAARAPVRSDSTKASQVGKLHVLKAARENNVCSPTAKDIPSVTIAGRVTTASSAVAPLKSPNNLKTTADRRLTVSPIRQTSSDKRHPSRIDFFNSLRKKNSGGHSAAVSDSNLAVSSLSASEKPDEQILETAAAVGKSENEPPTAGSVLGWLAENGRETVENNNVSEEPERSPGGGNKGSVSNAVVDPDDDPDTFLDPHEVAFLRSLGWEENGGGGALTEEEISSFYETMKSRKANAVSVAPGPNVGSLDSTSVLSSSDSENEA